MRKLATIGVASELFPIPGADAIEACRVGGWVCVAKKGEFAVSDKGIYFEIDSFLPGTDKRFEFLSKQFITYNDKVGARLRTVRLRGQLSQGLFLPLSLFPEFQDKEIGADVTAELGIEKWEPPLPADLAGEVAAFPHFFPKTEQERVQNLGDKLEQNNGQEFEVTIKLDGTSMSTFRKGEHIGVCSRNYELVETEKSKLWQVAKQTRLVKALEFLGKNLAFQGELIGEGIQGNPEKIKGQDFYLFDIYDIDEQRFLTPVERQGIVAFLKENEYDIKHVPILDNVTLSHKMEEILQMAEGVSLNPKERREGLVFKRLDGKFSFKAISNWYLEKHKDR